MSKRFNPTYEDHIRGLVKQYQAKYRISPDEFATLCCLSRATYYSRMKSPRDFTLDELLRLCKVLNMSLNELVGIEKAS